MRKKKPSHLSIILRLLPIILVLLGLEFLAISRVISVSQLQKVRLQPGSMQRAENGLRKALTIDPTNRTAHLFLGRLYVQKKDYLKAKTHTTEGLQLQTSVEALKQLASISLSLADYENARQVLEKVVRLNPGDSDSLERLAWIAIYQRDFKNVRQWLSQLIEYNPRNFNYYYLLGLLYEGEGLLEAAIDNYEKALFQPATLEYKPLFQIEEVKQRLSALRQRLQESSEKK